MLDVESCGVRLGCDTNDAATSEALLGPRTVQCGRSRQLRGHTDTVYQTIFTPDDKLIASVRNESDIHRH